MYIYNYFIILLDVCVSYDTQFDTIHDTEKLKIDSRYNSRFDNYGWNINFLAKYIWIDSLRMRSMGNSNSHYQSDSWELPKLDPPI